MNNEIKEILDKCTPYLFGDEVDKLLDYITNLQEENEYFSYCDKELRNKIKNFEYKANNLEEENKEQRNIIVKAYDEYMETIKNLKDQLQQKENIIKEVREYIEKHIAMFKNGDILVDMNIDELLEILDKEK